MMGSPQNNEKKRRFSDVHPLHRRSARRWILWLKNRGKTIDLKPTFYKNHPIFIVVTAVLIGSLAFWGTRRLFTRAEVADFYPLTCLGTWTNAQNAATEPETFKNGFTASTTTINEANAAAFSASSSQIFCGNFLPQDFSVQGEIKNVGLTIVWQVGGGVSSTDTFSETASSTDALPLFVPASTTLDGSGTSTPTSAQSLIRRNVFDFASLVNTVFADESSSTAQPPIDPPVAFAAPADGSQSSTVSSGTDAAQSSAPPVPSPSNPSSTDQAVDFTPSSATSTYDSSTEGGSNVFDASTASSVISTIDASATASASGVNDVSVATTTNQTTTIQTSTDTTVQPSTPPDDNFLEVGYSFNGQDWISLGRVNEGNWRNLTLTLPVMSWNDLKNLQIRIQGIPSALETIPSVLLDGMFVEVHYTTDLPANEIVKEHIPTGVLTLSSSTITLGEYVDVSGGAPNGTFTIFAEDNHDPATQFRYVYEAISDASGTVSLDTGTLSPGNFTIVDHSVPGACSDEYFEQCITRTEYEGRASFVVLPGQ